MVQVQELFDNHILTILMVVFCSLGVLVKCIIYGIYSNLIKASDNMANSSNELMKLIKMKFEACYKLKIGVNNVDIFVDKYMYKYKFCGLLLYTWENISGQFLILCLLTGAVGSGLAVYYDCGKTAILSTFFIGLFTSALLILCESFLNVPAKRNVICINMRDYLENMLKVKLEQKYFYPEQLEEYCNEYFVQEGKDNKKETVNKHELGKEEGTPELHIKDNTASTKEKMLQKDSLSVRKNTMKSNIGRGENRYSENRNKQENMDKKTLESLKINKKEEEIIEDILKEFMA